MSNKELIELIDKLTIIALRFEVAKENLKVVENLKSEYEELVDKFNNIVPNINVEELKVDEDLAYRLAIANKILTEIQ